MVLDDCTQNMQTLWHVSTSAITTYNGTMCLDVTDGVDSNGVKLQIWECSPTNVNQQWTRTNNSDGSYRLEWTNHSRCLDLRNGKKRKGARIQIWDCIECVETFNFCPITDSRKPGATPIKVRFCSLLLYCERLTPGILLVWWTTRF